MQPTAENKLLRFGSWATAFALVAVEILAIARIPTWRLVAPVRTPTTRDERIVFVRPARPRELPIARANEVPLRAPTLVSPSKKSEVVVSRLDTARGAALPVAVSIQPVNTRLTPDTLDHFRRTSIICAMGPCAGAQRIGISLETHPSIHDQEKAWHSVMRGLADESPLPALPGQRPQSGGGIRVPLWGGGPSDKQRKRDSTIHAYNKAVMQRMKLRVDSVLAARRDSATKADH